MTESGGNKSEMIVKTGMTGNEMKSKKPRQKRCVG